MKKYAALLTAVLVLAPAIALAAGSAGPELLDLRTGVTAELLGKTRGIAASLFPLALILGLLVEAFGGSPTESKGYGGVVARALLVVMLLGAYPKLFGTVINSTERLADRIAPADTWAKWQERMKRDVEALTSKPQRSPAANGRGELAPLADDGALDGLLPSSEQVAHYLGGMFFDSLVGLFVLVGHAFYWVFGQLSRILLALLYVLGPLAIVFHVPGPSKSAGKWFSAFVTVASWPVLSALLLAIATALMPRTAEAIEQDAYSAAFGGVAVSILMILLNFAVPFLATAIIGGRVGNLIGSSATAFLATTMASTGGLKQMLGGGAAGNAASAASPGFGTPPASPPEPGPAAPSAAAAPAAAPDVAVAGVPATPPSGPALGAHVGASADAPAPAPRRYNPYAKTNPEPLTAFALAPEPLPLAAAPLPLAAERPPVFNQPMGPPNAPPNERTTLKDGPVLIPISELARGPKTKPD